MGFEYKVFDNVSSILKDDLQVEIKSNSKLSIAAAYFSIYAFEELKKQLKDIDELRFIFTSPTFITEKTPKEKREFYIPRLAREKSIYGTEFEVKLRNELTQKAIAKECADWIKEKVQFKSNKTGQVIRQPIEILIIWSIALMLWKPIIRNWLRKYQRILDHYVGELGDDEYVKFLKTIEPNKTHAGYFSIDKKSGRSINPELKRGSTSSDDTDAYDLIMKNKERLLDRKEPVRFIFSHSALKEGWDNPNVFQICTLKESDASIRKRQEIGRGLRLSVNQDGDRMDASVLGEDVHNINTLTVIANESYQNFATALQNELAAIVTDRPKEVSVELFDGKVITTESGEAQTIDKTLAKKLYNHFVRQDYIDDAGALTDKYYEDKKAGTLSFPEEVKDCGDSIIKIIDTIYDVKGMMPEDARKNNVDIKIKDGALDKKEFLALWKKINVKSIYAVDFEGQELVDNAIEALNSKLEVSKIYVKITEGTMKSIDSKQALIEGKAFETKPSQSKMEVISSSGTNIKYDLVGKLVDETGLTRECIVKILSGIEKCVFEQFKQNPEEFIIKSARLINEQKATLIVQHITYSKIEGDEGIYSTDIFTEPTLKGKLGINTMIATKSIYDHLLYDSNGEKEFATQLEESQDVVVYVKLPKGFYISTPVGKYNPDWAIAFNQEHIKHIYFIAETKGSMETLELREIESAKIKCARKHFAAISNEEVRYDVVSNYGELITKVMR